MAVGRSVGSGPRRDFRSRQLPELDLDADLLSTAQQGQCDCVTWLMTVDGFRERRLALEGLGVDGGDDVLLPESGRCAGDPGTTWPTTMPSWAWTPSLAARAGFSGTY